MRPYTEVTKEAAWSNRLDHPCHMRSGNNDFIGLDGVYYFAVAANPTEWLSLRFSKHHVCTHIGDEFPKRVTTSVTDRDPTFKQGPVLDDLRWAASIRPLWFLIIDSL